VLREVFAVFLEQANYL